MEHECLNKPNNIEISKEIDNWVLDLFEEKDDTNDLDKYEFVRGFFIKYCPFCGKELT